MTRVKRGTIANKRRKNLLKEAKGFRYGRKINIAKLKKPYYMPGAILSKIEKGKNEKKDNYGK